MIQQDYSFICLNEEGYKRIIELSSFSYLENDDLSEPHLDFDELLEELMVLHFFRNYIWFIWTII